MVKMQEKNLKVYIHNGIVGNLIVFLCGVAVIIIGAIAEISIKDTLAFMLLFILCGIFIVIFSIISLFFILKNKVIIGEVRINSYGNFGLSKTMNISELNRIVVYRVKRLGGIISRIILDDGTFNNDGDPRAIISNKFETTTSWIFLEFSRKKLNRLKNRFPDVNIDIIDKNLI